MRENKAYFRARKHKKTKMASIKFRNVATKSDLASAFFYPSRALGSAWNQRLLRFLRFAAAQATFLELVERDVALPGSVAERFLGDSLKLGVLIFELFVHRLELFSCHFHLLINWEGLCKGITFAVKYDRNIHFKNVYYGRILQRQLNLIRRFWDKSNK